MPHPLHKTRKWIFYSRLQQSIPNRNTKVITSNSNHDYLLNTRFKTLCNLLLDLDLTSLQESLKQRMKQNQTQLYIRIQIKI